MFILVAHSWSLSYAYKKVYVKFVIKTASMYNKFSLRKETVVEGIFCF